MMKHESIRFRRRGFARGDVGGAIFVIVLLGATCAVVLAQMRNRAGDQRCRENLIEMVRAWDLYAQGNRERLPLVGTIEIEGQPMDPTTAHLHSMMIFNNYYSPETTVCPNEESPYIHVKSDFDRRTAASEPNLPFDPTFSCDITGKTGDSNVSYANLAPFNSSGRGNSTAASPRWPAGLVLADRGPGNGQHDPNSMSYNNHGYGGWWRGFLASVDGSVREFEEQPQPGTGFVPDGLRYGRKNLQDNIYREDDPQGHTDIWLGIFAASHGNADEVIPLWD